MRSITILAALATAAVCLPALADGPYTITWWTADGGGGTSAGGGWTLSGTIGQPDAGSMIAPGWSVSGGFWNFNPICPADFNADGFIDFFDFNDFSACFDENVCPPGKTADFNNDGFVDFFDYNDFIGAFELGC